MVLSCGLGEGRKGRRERGRRREKERRGGGEREEERKGGGGTSENELVCSELLYVTYVIFHAFVGF